MFALPRCGEATLRIKARQKMLTCPVRGPEEDKKAPQKGGSDGAQPPLLAADRGKAFQRLVISGFPVRQLRRDGECGLGFDIETEISSVSEQDAEAIIYLTNQDSFGTLVSVR